MKKFISMVMAAAMVVSLVPATAFAMDGEVVATAKVVKAAELGESKNDITIEVEDAPEIKITATDVDWKETDGSNSEATIKLTLDNAEFKATTKSDFADLITMVCDDITGDNEITGDEVEALISEFEINSDKDEIEFTVSHPGEEGYHEDDVMYIDLYTLVTKTKVGAEATVSVKSSDLNLDAKDLVFATIVDKAIEVEIDDTVDVAPEEIKELEELTIEAVVGDYLSDNISWNEDENGKKWAELTLKVSKGFEFASKASEVLINGDAYANDVTVDEDEITIYLTNPGIASRNDEFVITGLKVEATSAKAGDVCTLTVDVDDVDAVKVEVATVVDNALTISVDEDEDVPEIWSGVDADNTYLTDDEDHMSLEVTIEETFEASYSDKDEIELTLPEGVYVTDVNIVTDDVVVVGEDLDLKGAFEVAYNEGDYKSFIFEKRAFVESDPEEDNAIEMAFELELVADPGFVGDVVMEMLIDGESAGEVTIATFKTPMVVEAAQNDLKIDYRNTEVGSDIVVKEAEAGLWAKGLKVGFGLDKYIAFEDDATYTVNEESDMEVDDDTITVDGVDVTVFEVDEESDDEAAVVTISDIALYMNRSLPAGAYDLEMVVNNAVAEYVAEELFGKEAHEKGCEGDSIKHDCDAYVYIDDVSDYSDVVKEAWVNIVTAGREADDASFTTKVVVPVGEAYLIAGEQTVALDVPAYVSEAGYTMLPVRAVATGLGINNSNVLWDQTTKTVTILYGQRIITMVAGQKVVNVNGSVIPASATVEIVDGRAFLPMRDLATALGVTDITWDAATKTATLNGNA